MSNKNPNTATFNNLFLCIGCRQPINDKDAYCDFCAYDFDETNHRIVKIHAPLWAWRVILSALEALAANPFLDDATSRELNNSLPELVTEDNTCFSLTDANNY